MSIQTTLNFDIAGNFTYDSDKIEFLSASARLKLQTGPLSFTQDYTTDSGFIYDNTKLEFSSGQLQQKSQSHSNSILGATYSNAKNASWPSGVTAVDVGTPLLTGGRLACAGGNNGVYYESALIGSLSSTGTIKFKYQPNYSGTPSVNSGVIYLGDPLNLGGANQLILLHSASGGTWRITARNSSGNLFYSASVIGPVWSPVAGQTYEIELVLDTLAVGFGLFIDGVLHGTLNGTFTRSSSATRLYIGSNPTYAPALADFDDVIIFSDAQHSSSYTPGYSIPETLYAASEATLPVWTHSLLGTMVSFIDLNESGSAGLTYAISVNGGTFSSPATAGSIAPSLGGSNTAQLRVYFPASNSQGYVTQSTLNYIGQTQYPTDDPYVTPNAGTYLDDLLNFESSFTGEVKFVLLKGSIAYYWNGTAWAVSDNSWAQSNSSSEILSNAASLTNTGILFKPRAILRSADGQTTPILTSVSYEYDFFVSATESPPTCAIYGFLSDILGEGADGAIIHISVDEAQWISGHFLPKESWRFQADANGYWEAELVQGAVLSFYVEYDNQISDLGSATIPASVSRDFKDLTYS